MRGLVVGVDEVDNLGRLEHKQKSEEKESENCHVYILWSMPFISYFTLIFTLFLPEKIKNCAQKSKNRNVNQSDVLAGSFVVTKRCFRTREACIVF